MAAVCPTCGAETKEDDLYCATCGNRLVGGSQAASYWTSPIKESSAPRFPGADILVAILFFAGLVVLVFGFYLVIKATELPTEVQNVMIGSGISTLIGSLGIFALAVIIRLLVALEGGIHRLGEGRNPPH